MSAPAQCLVGIRVTEGVATTEYMPSNAELRKMGRESEAVPQMDRTEEVDD